MGRAPRTQAGEQLWAKDVRARRLVHGWTQQRLAQALYTTRWTVARWESGRQQPSQLALDRLRQLLPLEEAA